VVLSEADLVHWRRRVVEACIYGVDKNEMAVELAKLSLWLVTAAADKPLSFLDHHLRHGDSLVGAWLADLERPPLSSSQTAAEGQEPLFDESAFTGDAGLAVKGLMTIERLPSEDIEDVYAKERTYREIRQTHLARWRELANLWVSAYFGNDDEPGGVPRPGAAAAGAGRREYAAREPGPALPDPPGPGPARLFPLGAGISGGLF
jgi:hypothetical protein